MEAGCEPLLVHPINFPNPALDPVAHDRSAHFAVNADAEFFLSPLDFKHHKDKTWRSQAHPFRKYLPKQMGAGDPFFPGESGLLRPVFALTF